MTDVKERLGAYTAYLAEGLIPSFASSEVVLGERSASFTIVILLVADFQLASCLRCHM